MVATPEVSQRCQGCQESVFQVWPPHHVGPHSSWAGGTQWLPAHAHVTGLMQAQKAGFWELLPLKRLEPVQLPAPWPAALDAYSDSQG